MLDTININDVEFGTREHPIKKDDRVAANQIKTRIPSFNAIYKYWKKKVAVIRTNLLEKAKEGLVSGEYYADASGNLSSVANMKMNVMTSVIARLESKLDFKSKEDVPSLYVRNRAIKLKKKMMENLTSNGSNVYSVGLDKYDKIFSENEDSPVNNNEVPVTDNGTELNVEEIAANNEGQIADEVNSVMGSVAASDEPIVDEVVTADHDEGFSQIDENDIKSAILGKFSEINAENEEATPVAPEVVAEPVESEETKIPIPVISSDEVAATVRNGATELDSFSARLDAIRRNIDEAVSQGIKISLSGASEAKINHYDENGMPIHQDPDNSNLDEYVYTPMTDNEIAQARENIEYDAYENEYRKRWHEIANSSEPVEEVVVDTNEQAMNEEPVVTDVISTDAAPEITDSVSFTKFPTAESIHTSPSVSLENVVYESSPVIPITNVNEDTAIRDEVIIVPPRDDDGLVSDLEDPIEEYIFHEEDTNSQEEDLHFDYSEATGKDIAQALETEKSVSGLEALQARALQLNAQLKDSEARLDSVRQEQENTARMACDMRVAIDAKRDALEHMLEEVCANLTERIEANNSSVAIAENDTNVTRSVIEQLVSEGEDYDAKLGEFGAMIKGRAA